MNKFFHSVYLDSDKCTGCITCLKRCPTQAIRVRDGKAHIINEFCIDCGECIRHCPHHAKHTKRDFIPVLKDYKYCFFHSDASQAIGKVAIDYRNVDLITIAPHKFYGMLGTGMLIKKKKVGLKTQIDGGKSTTVFRSGTPELAHIVSIEKALKIALSKQQEREIYVKSINHQMLEQLKQYDQVLINRTKYSLPHVINISLKGMKATKFAQMLDQQGIYISTKTSCCPVETPSKMVYALYQDRQRAMSSFRISLSYLTTEKEVQDFLKIFDQCYKECFGNGKI